MSYYDIPTDPKLAKPILQRFIRENAATQGDIATQRRRPDPPRNLIAQPGTAECLLTWNSPQITYGILGYKVYKDNEGNLFDTINDQSNRSITIKLPASTPTMVYVSCYTALMESIKVGILATANNQQYVVQGTSGGTGGTSPSPPPDYGQEPSGGKQGGSVD